MSNEPPLDDLGDAELLRRARRSGSAFRVIYDRHATRLYAFLSRRTGDATAAFELTAETFAEAWLSRERFVDRGEGAAPWLFGIARNVLAASIRDAAVERRARSRVGLDAAVDVAAPRAEWLAGFDEDLASALADLPEQQRAVIEMRVLDGRPYADVATKLDITPGAARVRAHRGLAALRASLDPRQGSVAPSVVPPVVRPVASSRENIR
jgi:RNA polymerase sigma-70 factor (ECF subfamily)